MEIILKGGILWVRRDINTKVYEQELKIVRKGCGIMSEIARLECRVQNGKSLRDNLKE